MIQEAAEHYVAMAQQLRAEELPHGTQWRNVEAFREKLVAGKEYQWINFREQKWVVRRAGGHLGTRGW